MGFAYLLTRETVIPVTKRVMFCTPDSFCCQLQYHELMQESSSKNEDMAFISHKLDVETARRTEMQNEQVQLRADNHQLQQKLTLLQTRLAWEQVCCSCQ